MKIEKVSYSDPNQEEVSRWLDHIIELTILEALECLDKTKIELKTSKYMGEKII